MMKDCPRHFVGHEPSMCRNTHSIISSFRLTHAHPDGVATTMNVAVPNNEPLFPLTLRNSIHLPCVS